jgi:hypothetical protein
MKTRILAALAPLTLAAGLGACGGNSTVTIHSTGLGDVPAVGLLAAGVLGGDQAGEPMNAGAEGNWRHSATSAARSGRSARRYRGSGTAW